MENDLLLKRVLYCSEYFIVRVYFLQKKIAFIFNGIKTVPSHFRSPVQSAETGNISLVYQAEIVMGVPSDHAYGDKHGLIFLIKKKCKEKKKKKGQKIVAIATVQIQ